MPRGDRFAGDLDDGIIVRPECQLPGGLAPHRGGDVVDRATGALLGMACRDALGVPYEYGTPPQGAAQMIGGGLGGYALGEWSDDTQMAVCIAEVGASGVPLTSRAGLDAVASSFERWMADGPADVGARTQTVLDRARDLPGPPSRGLGFAARRLYLDTGRTAGNGALMRTAPVALTSLTGRWQVAFAARAVAELTRGHSAHCASHLRYGLQAAVQIGGDTDTVAAIAGALLGARWGAAAILARWRQSVHGWPGMRGEDLEALACSIVGASRPAGPTTAPLQWP